MAIGNTPFIYCKDCLYLTKKFQVQYFEENKIMLPFCSFYNLHFSSVRQIEQCSKTCLHYDEGNI